MGSVNVRTLRTLDEVVLTGRHRGIDLVILGTTGAEGAWEAGCGLVDLFLDEQAIPGAKALVVDQLHASVRAAVELRRIVP